MGLGNPGAEYAATRHNVGYRVVDTIAGEGARFERRPRFLFLGTRVGGRRVLLVKPTTYMNLSGEAAVAVIREFPVELANILVVSDDVYLPLGRMRIRERGGDGGQKGLGSIIEETGTEAFPRLRLGVGPPDESLDLADFVLQEIPDADRETVANMITDAVGCVRLWVTQGVRRAMGKFNCKDPLKEGGQGEEKAEDR